MLLPEVEYARPSNLEEALAAMSTSVGARALAGGQTLVNVMKTRAAAPDVLVDLADVEELKGISVSSDGSLELGAMATYTDVMASPEVDENAPILAEVCATIADVQVRNRGTVGGNVCSNDPTNHLPPVMVTTGARMTIVGPGGERTVSAEEFFLGVYMTAVGPGELLTRISVPRSQGGDGFAAVTIGREGTCIVNAAASVNDGGARVAIGCVAAVPVVVATPADEQAVSAAVRGADLDPPSDVHASAEYRRHLAEVLARRAVVQATQRGRS